MSEIDNRVIKEAYYFLEHKTTVRKMAEIFCVSKSTIHYDLSKRLKKMNRALYEKVSKIFAQNFAEKHYRGGLATKLKYQQNIYIN